jgi:cell division protein FtsL
MKRETVEVALAAMLVAGIVGTGIQMVTTKHQSRLLFQELESLRGEHDRLLDDWSALQLEVSTLGAHATIDRIAREQLGMVEPSAQWLYPEPAP